MVHNTESLKLAIDAAFSETSGFSEFLMAAIGLDFIESKDISLDIFKESFLEETPLKEGQMTCVVDGIERSTQNDQGKLIHWSEEGIRNFWQWFDHSKFVDETGRPCVVYHGSTALDFNVFDTMGHGKTEGGGAFFSNHLDSAMTYGNVRDFYLKSGDKVAEISFEGHQWNNGPKEYIAYDEEGDYIETCETIAEAKVFAGTKGNVIDYSLDLNEEGLLDINLESDGCPLTTDDYASQARDLGFDSMIVRQVIDVKEGADSAKPSDVFVVFDPSQIKSAASLGQFNPNNPDIRFSKKNKIIAYVVNGRTKLVTDHIDQNLDNIKGIILHEVGVHVLKLGKKLTTFQSILNDFNQMKTLGHPKVLAAFKRVPLETPLHLVTEEALGYFVEDNPELSFSKRMIAWFKIQVCKLSFSFKNNEDSILFQWAKKLSGDDLVYLASQATRHAVAILACPDQSTAIINREGILSANTSLTPPLLTSSPP